MTLAEVRELFAYNAWANRRFFAALEPLPAESYFRDLKNSHGGLHGTLCHIVWAEQLWLNRWLGKPNPAVPQGRDLTTLAAAGARWEAIETERDAFLTGLAERRLDETVAVKPSTAGVCAHVPRDVSPRGRSFDLSPGTTRHAAPTGGRDAAGDGADRVLSRASRPRHVTG